MRVITFNSKGAFEVPAEKLSALDVPFTVSSVRGTNKLEINPDSLSPLAVQTVGTVDVASIYRIPLKENKFLDVLEVYPGQMMLVGVGVPDEKRGENEPIYLQNLAGKELTEFVFSEGVNADKVMDDVKEILNDPDLSSELEEEVGADALSELVAGMDEAEKGNFQPLFDVVRNVAQKLGKSFRIYFPGVAAEIKEKDDSGKTVYNFEKIRPQETLTREAVLKAFAEGKAQKLTLNGIIIGVTNSNDVAIAFTPERLNLMSSLAAAKTLTNRSVAFKAFNYLSNLTVKRILNAREKVVAKIDKYMKDMEEKGDTYGIDTLQELKEIINKGDEKELAEILVKAHNVKNTIIKQFFDKEPIFNVSELLKRRADGTYFLRNYMSNYGISLEDFSKFKALIFTVVPRPIKVEGQWQIQKGLKPIGGIIEENGQKTTYAFEKSDAYTMAFDYPIFKVLKAVTIDSDKYQWKQIRALFGDGFEKFKGLGQIEKDLASFKNASAVYTDFIKYIRNVVSDIIYREDAKLNEEEAKKAVAEKLLSDEVVFDYISSMTEFLAGRQSKIYSFSKMLEGNPNPAKFAHFLVRKGFVFYHKGSNSYRIAVKRVKENAKEIEKRLKPGYSALKAVKAVANTLNAILLTSFTPDKKAVKDAEILTEQITNAIKLAVSLESVQKKKYTSVAIESFKKKSEQEAEKAAAEPEKANRTATKPVADAGISVEKPEGESLEAVKEQIARKTDAISVNIDLEEEESVVLDEEDIDLDDVLDAAKSGIEEDIDFGIDL